MHMANVYSPLVAGDRQTTLLPEFTVLKLLNLLSYIISCVLQLFINLHTQKIVILVEFFFFYLDFRMP